jgi:hypothetical protein
MDNAEYLIFSRKAMLILLVSGKQMTGTFSHLASQQISPPWCRLGGLVSQLHKLQVL